MPLQIQYRDGSTLSFERGDAEDLVVRDATETRQGWNMLVRGLLVSSCTELEVPVVVKYVLNKRYIMRVVHERNFYHQFLDLQGRQIPRFYGYFEHLTDDMCEPKAAFVLQDLNAVGSSANGPLWKRDLDFRWSLVNLILTIHKRGYALGERIAIFDVNGQPVISGFAGTLRHECPAIDHPSLGRNQLSPRQMDFPCDELYFYCDLAGVWTPRMFDFYHHRCETKMLFTKWMSVADLALEHATPQEAASVARDALQFIAQTYLPYLLPRLQEQFAKFDEADGLELYMSSRRAAMGADGRPRDPRRGFRPMDYARPHMSWPRRSPITYPAAVAVPVSDDVAVHDDAEVIDNTHPKSPDPEHGGGKPATISPSTSGSSASHSQGSDVNPDPNPSA
ncbi:hypothetical protein EXIGLDRAFT_829204 [Exidia glandulosa HHB12029]|uniref:Uncharacterized protein n=1 Tax=Exidia glandulosa HHB12029 TaxID=1314781 RepID=A0A165PUM2_EXIGL|nr:hypothetical protein EXIGLDRAFT_829204 [Exidia glandulosa HHB12029]